MEEDSLNNKEKSIAILPFKNLSDNKENQYFADGMMEGILNNLFRIRELRVISRTSVEQFRESTLSSPQIGEKLGINYLLEGSVERDTNEVRVFVQLIDARKDQHIYSDEFDRKWTDIFTIQSDIAKQIANELDAILSDEEIGQIKKMPTNSPEAYDSYLKARFFFNKASDVQRVDISSEGLKSSIQYYEKAIMEDSTFALAYSGLSNAWYNLCAWGWYQPYHEGIGKARELSNKALEIDPDCSEAHAVKGACYFYPDRKFKDAEKELLTSLRLNPNYAYAHQLYAQLLMITGPIEKSREHMDRVLELEPYFWVAHNLNSWIYYFERKNKDGIEACISGRDLNPYSLDNDWLFIIHYAKLGEAEKSAKELKDIFSRYLKTNKYDNEITDVYKRSGIKGLFEWLIDLNINKPVGLEGMNGHPFYIAWWYAILGRKEESIYWLEKVSKSQHIPYHYFDLITNNPDFDFVRDDPRFLKIMEEFGLIQFSTRKIR
jgi:TolB-like protein/Flp pilus assembly protein TadD